MNASAFDLASVRSPSSAITPPVGTTFSERNVPVAPQAATTSDATRALRFMAARLAMRAWRRNAGALAFALAAIGCGNTPGASPKEPTASAADAGAAPSGDDELDLSL